MTQIKKSNIYVILALFFILIIGAFTYINYFSQPTTNTPNQTTQNTIIPDFNPIPSAEADYSNIINFDSEMNKQSVEENIEIYPEIETNFVWEDDKTLKIEVKDSLEEDTDFIVNISKDAQDINGKNIEKEIVQQFKVGGIAKVDFITPEGEITDLSKNITVRFSKPMISLTTLDNQPECPIKITPELPGKCVWISTSTFQFRPTQGFPIGAKYQVTIPEGIQTIAGDKTTNSVSTEITTPKFEILSAPKNGFKDKPLIIVFNTPISLENFKENFEINGVNTSELDIDYFKVGSKIEGEQIIKKDIISILPKSKDWGYGKNYTYTLKPGLKSIRGNVTFGEIKKEIFSIQELLTDYRAFVYNDETIENKEITTNMKKAQNENIITKTNPKLLLSFYEEISLDKSLFLATNENGNSINFDIKYAKTLEYIDGEKEVKENKKYIILELKTDKISSLKLKINASKVSKSEDKELLFKTKADNEITDFKFVNYKKSCLTLKNPIDSYSYYGDRNNDNFYFKEKPLSGILSPSQEKEATDGKVNYISLVGQYTRDDDCKYEAGKNKYIVNTTLNPSSDYNLTIKKSLLDEDNYPLTQDYTTNFKTDKAMNEDKNVSIIDSRGFILVPKDIKPLGVAVQTVNLDKVSVEVCEGDFDVEDLDYIKNSKCETKEVSINNLGFTTNFSVLNLEEIFGKEFSKSLITLKVEKLKEDKSEYELKNEDRDYYRVSKIHYLRTNISLVSKVSKESSLWISDFKTGEVLTDQVVKIQRYESKSEYSTFGKYLGTSRTFKENVEFKAGKDGLYKLYGNLNGYLLITLKSGEQILFNGSNYYSNTLEKTYLTTDRPIYKPGDMVKIKGVVRTETATNYEISEGSQTLHINDSKYQELTNENVNLSENGSFEYELKLKNDASLGNYSIELINSNISSVVRIFFSVEEYEKPDFKIEAKPTKDTYLYTGTPEVEINSEYYIGTPLSNGAGYYGITASDYNFDGGKTTGFTWGENNNYWRYWIDSSSSSNNIFYKVDFNLDSKGNVKIPIDTSKTTKDKIYNTSITITDPNTQKSVSTSTSFKVLNSDIFVGLKQDKYYYNFGDPAKLDFVTVDLEGNKVGNQKVKFKVYKVNYTYDKTTYTTEKQEKLLTEKDLATGKDGLVSEQYKLQDYGEFRFEIELANGKYKTTKTFYVSGSDLVRPADQEHDLNIIADKEKYEIGDPADFIIQSPVTGVKALVTVEKLDKVLFEEVIDISSNSQKYSLPIKKEYLPNFELKVFIIKPSTNSTETINKLKELRLKMIDLEEELYGDSKDEIIPFYVTYDILYKGGCIPPYRKEINLDKDLLKKLAELNTQEQQLMQEILPNYYSGETPVKISLDTIELQSKVETDKDDYLPSDSSTIEITILDSRGAPVNGEAAISVVDESLLALKNNDTNIVDFFYSDKPNYIRTLFNISDLIKRFEFKQENFSDVPATGGGGIMYESDMEMEEGANLDSMKIKALSPAMDKYDSNSISNNDSNATKLRTDFKDSAYYNGTVKVTNGVAKINIEKLPDNLTTWVIKGFAVTKDTKVGNFESKFKVKKTLNLLPSIPRFFVSGDTLEISATVVNNSDKSIKIQPSIEITNAEVLEEAEKQEIPENGQKLITWKVKVNGMKNDIDWNSYFSDITLKVSATGLFSGNLQDSLKVSKKIIPYSTPEYTFTNGSTYDISYEEKINLPDYVDKTQGQLDISYGPTILTSLLDNVENLASMPLDNFYNTVSALKKGAVLKGLYEKAGRLEEFNEITVIDYNGFTHKLKDIIELRIKDLKNYQNSDGGMKVYSDCIPRYGMKTCSNFDLTGDFLNMVKLLKDAGYTIDEDMVNKALSYYEKELEQIIADSESRGGTYRNIDPFYEIIGYAPEFINKYLLSPRFSDDYEFDNISKLKIILLHQEINPKSEVIDKYTKELKNKTIIEARGTLVPANKYSRDNITSTALATRVFIGSGETEKLIIENLARWLIAQKRENGEFGSNYDSVEVLKAITSYITYTKELDDVNFTAKGFLNNNEIINEIFNDENKFELKQKSFSLKDYLKFAVDNTLGFKKEGTGKLYYDIGLRYFLPIEKIEARDEGIIVQRNYYNYDEYNEAYEEQCIKPYWFGYYDDYYGGYCKRVKTKNIESVSGGKKGDLLVGEIEIIVPSERNNVVVNNFIPAGAEILNVNLDTTGADIKEISGEDGNNYWRGGFSHIDIKDDRVLLFADHLYKGSYKYTYVIKLNHKGEYHNRPAVAEEMKKPEIWGRSGGEMFVVE